MANKLIITGILATVSCLCFGQRISRSVNESWSFKSGNAADTIVVNVPHSWNRLDCQDEIPGYFRGKGEYSKLVRINENIGTNSFFLNFEGVNQVAEVYVNGRFAGKHTGGYTAFCLDVTEFLRQGDNSLRVLVDNSHDENIPPLSADFTFFGGIYRDVNLIVTPKIHVSTTHYATSGVYITTADEDKPVAKARVKTYLSNDSDTSASVLLKHSVYAPDGTFVAESNKRIRLQAGIENYCDESEIQISDPVLWTMEEAGLYRILTEVVTKDGRMKDAVSNSFGIRWFEFDPDEGFSLNGKYTKLVGTNRHQDYFQKANALNDEMHVRDVRMLKEMGGNFLRIAHYPQDPVITQMCDRYGIVASVEIPIVNAITMSEEFRKNCIEMTKEMIWQDYNSPSVVMWAYMNEIMLRPPYNKDNEAEKREYMDFLYGIASDIENTIRTLDPKRYSMLPCHGNSAIYDECGISGLPMVLGWNLYNGWYSNGLDGFEKTLERLHVKYPAQSLLVTEYGADVDPRLHSFDPERFDFSCEYGVKYHRHYIPEILKRKWLAGTTVWNINDFYSESRLDAVPRVNNKGLTGLDRERKDSYYLYKAWLSSEPVLVIGGHGWKTRGGVANEDGRCIQPIEVYSNASHVELFLDGVSLGRHPVENMTAVFDVPFADGLNVIEAVADKDGRQLRDLQKVDFRMVPACLGEFTEMNVMLGSKRYFEDREAEMVWIPEQEYKPGSWGYVGGYAARTKTRHGSLPCSDVDVLNTVHDPLFQTQRRNIQAFKADVPDGQYYVYLYFSELVPDKEKESLVYNLGNDIVGETAVSRIFDVTVNGVTVMKDFDIRKECGAETAVVRKFTIDAYGQNGIDIRFIPGNGEPILNAVRIYRCF